MKSLVFFLFVIQFLCSAQDDDKKIKLEKYVECIDNYELYNYSEIESLSSEEFNKIIKIAYEAIEFASSDLIKISKTDVKYKKASSNLSRGVKERYSYIIETLLRIPVFVKAKIISNKEINKDGFAQINLILEPEYILKGREQFLAQPEFEVYYRRYEYVSDSVDYKKGKSYLFALWDRNEPKNKMFAVATWISGYNSRFLIEDSLLRDGNNFFNMGNKVNWNDFVQNFKEMITCIIKEKGLEKFKMQNIHRQRRQNIENNNRQ